MLMSLIIRSPAMPRGECAWLILRLKPLPALNHFSPPVFSFTSAVHPGWRILIMLTISFSTALQCWHPKDKFDRKKLNGLFLLQCFTIAVSPSTSSIHQRCLWRLFFDTWFSRLKSVGSVGLFVSPVSFTVHMFVIHKDYLPLEGGGGLKWLQLLNLCSRAFSRHSCISPLHLLFWSLFWRLVHILLKSNNFTNYRIISTFSHFP